MSEDRLRRLLHGMAADQPASADRWGALVARRRRRQAWQAGAVGTTGLAVVLAGVLALQGGGTTQTLISADPTDTPTPVATTAEPTPSATAGPAAPTPRPVATASPEPTATATPTVPTAVPPVGHPAGPVRLAAVGSWSYAAPASLVGSSPRTDVPELLRNWAASVNAAGGIVGRRVELTVLDAQGSTKALHEDVEQLVSRGVDAFVHTDVDAYVESYLRGKGIPVLGGDLGSSLWSSSPVLFAQGTDSTALADGLAVLAAREVPHGHLGVVCTDVCTGPARLIEDRRAALYGLDPTSLERQSASSTDYTGTAIRMKQAGVDVVALALAPEQAAGFARNADDIGWHPRYVLSSVLAADDTALNEPLLRGALTPQQVLPWPAAPAAYREVVPSGAKQSVVLTSAWASAQLAQDVIRSAGPMGGDLLRVAQAQAGSTVGGVVPPLAPGHVQRCFFVAQVGTGVWHAPDGLATSCGKP